jgi:hypothetical protein
MFRRFGTLFSISIGGGAARILRDYTAYKYGTHRCSETSVLKIQASGNHPKEIIQRNFTIVYFWRITKSFEKTDHKPPHMSARFCAQNNAIQRRQFCVKFCGLQFSKMC